MHQNRLLLAQTLLGELTALPQTPLLDLREPTSFQESYNSGNLPHDWKTANIVPIYKKGDRADPNNYRPVSLTSVPCKLMESVIKDNIAGFLEENKVISSCR